jgi:hypothetical protein
MPGGVEMGAGALGGLTSREATDPRIVGARLPPTRAILGPASLFYPPAGIGRALDEGLLPQWRARPAASQGLARRLGLVELGAQLSLEPR